MSETSDLPPDSAASGDQPPPLAPIRIAGQYIKDLSFEVPGAPEIYAQLQQEAPEIPISIDVAARPLNETAYEVSLTIHLEATLQSRKAFILELTYCAAVEVNKQIVAEEHIHPLLMIEIPRQLFPFARQIVSDATGHGGFPPLQLQIVDFALLYRQKWGIPGQAQPQPQPAVH
ncbi:MAG: protein-export chaperone SecB [Rhodospirillaceae bacterium]